MCLKVYLRTVLVAIFGFIVTSLISAQEYNDKITKELTFTTSKKVFVLYNLFGSVDIVGTANSKVKVIANRHLKGDTKNDLEIAKKELHLKAEKHGDTIIVYLKSPYFDTRPRKNCRNHNGFPDNYSFVYDFNIQVPKNAEVIVNTVNDGDIYVKNIHGKLNSNNVNGSIRLENISGQTKAHTVNGKVKATYNTNPNGNSSFKSINGDIDIICSNNLSAIVDYQSMNGEFYTNYSVKYLPNKIKKSEKKRGKKSFYHLSQKPQLKIGAGKIKLSLETLNGDMTVKHK